MKVITEPRVEVIAAPAFFGHSRYEVPETNNDAVRLGAFAAKGCYDAFGTDGRSCEDNQERIIEQRHGSVLEHLNFSLFIEGITRGLSLELNRHRFFAISQRSTRYTSEEDAAIVLDPFYASLWAEFGEEGIPFSDEGGYTPTTPNTGAALICHHLNACRSAFERYRHEVAELSMLASQDLSKTERRKWARGKARNLLPHALETRGTYTASLRGWRWFIESRSDRHAEAEIRRLAGAVYDELRESDAGFYLSDYTAAVVNGLREFTTLNRKV